MLKLLLILLIGLVFETAGVVLLKPRVTVNTLPAIPVTSICSEST